MARRKRKLLWTSQTFYPIVPPQGSPLLNTAKSVSDRVPDFARTCAPSYVMQTAVSVERQITKNANIAVSYFNSRGLHQFLTRNINAPLPGTYDPNNPASGIRPFGDAAGNIYQYESGGTMEQNQLIVNANVKVGSKVSLFGWYTFNNVNANTTGANSFPNNQYNLEENYGPTSYDVRNRAFIGGTIALPYAVAAESVPGGELAAFRSTSRWGRTTTATRSSTTDLRLPHQGRRGQTLW